MRTTSILLWAEKQTHTEQTNSFSRSPRPGPPLGWMPAISAESSDGEDLLF